MSNFLGSDPLGLAFLSKEGLSAGILIEQMAGRVYYNHKYTRKTREQNALWPATTASGMQYSYLLDEEPPFCFGRHGVVFLIFFSGRLANRMAIPATKVVKKIVAASLAKACKKSIGISPPFPRYIRKRKCIPPAPSSWYKLYHISTRMQENIGGVPAVMPSCFS